MRKYDNFCKALKNLKESSKLQEPYTIVEQTGIVGLFEICFEQSWKLMKEVLEHNGVFENRTSSPRSVIKAAYESGMINDVDGWLELMSDRNLAAHIYSENHAAGVIRRLRAQYVALFDKLKEEIDARWLA